MVSMYEEYTQDEHPVSEVLNCWSAGMENTWKIPQPTLVGGWQFKP